MICNRSLLIQFCSSVVVLAATTWAGADVVVRRGAAGELRGRVTIDDAGVTVRSESGARHVVPWDRVREVRTDQPLPGLNSHMRIAEDLWRARSRLERGDTVLAERLFSSLFVRFRGQTHETALVAAEGLLRCCLARGGQAEAVIPALETIRLRREGIQTDSYSMLPPVVDETTELCIQLAPFWVADRHLLTLDDALDRYDSKRDQVVAAMASLLHRAVRRQLGGPAPERSVGIPDDHPGLHLLDQVIDAAFGDSTSRRRARESMLAGLENRPAWVRAWTRMAAGWGQLDNTDGSRTDEGLVHLTYLPARYASSQPFLAGLALDRIRSVMEARGETAAVEVLENELKRRFPGHPVLRRFIGVTHTRSRSQGAADYA